MRLSKASYFADFAVYPPMVLLLLILAMRQASSALWIVWSIACLAGIAAWTFLEYVIHRAVLDLVESGGNLLWRPRPAVVGNGIQLGQRAYRGTHARLSVVRGRAPRGPSLATASRLLPMPIEASAPTTSPRTPAVQFRCYHSVLGSRVRQRARRAVIALGAARSSRRPVLSLPSSMPRLVPCCFSSFSGL